ncbi:pentatricopeptide repeat-containing protein At5g13270, chloroplastic [Daucus carota subsp. sativus]|uniref:DYW domain-containing protein n=2 Tax=Daucus carota subsp. sativus TaxID=79200 RepID=A0A175YR57_DAUCS|nr:PREDICTED: pentatricopeptide repeat-containing protein At5g13270, chloroplastic [Daucus carota subsp. sativus]
MMMTGSLSISLNSSQVVMVSASLNKLKTGSYNNSSGMMIPSWVSLKTKTTPSSSTASTKLHNNGGGDLENMHLVSLAKQGKLSEANLFVHEMDQAGIAVSYRSYLSLFESCAVSRSLFYANLFHAHLSAKTDENNNVPAFVFNCILRMYCECGRVFHAHNLFDQMSDKTFSSWDIIISAYAQRGDLRNALLLFSNMQFSGLHPQIYFSLFKSLSNTSCLEVGRQLHSHVLRAGYADNDSMKTAIANMYAKCGFLKGAKLLIDRMCQKNVVAMTGLMVAYVQGGNNYDAFRLFATMVESGAQLDEFVFSITLKACAQLEDMEMGQQIHAYIMKTGLEQEVSVGTPLVDFYAKCASMESCRKAFLRIIEPNDVSWHALISGYCQIGEFGECIRTFTSLRRSNVVLLNSFMYTTILQCCSAVADFSLGTQAHGDAIKRGLVSYLHGESAMVTMYAKCGRLDYAYQVFESIVQPDVVAWTAIIAGCACHGHASEALRFFRRMQACGVGPNAVTFIALLTACSHSGLVREAEQYLKAMSSTYGVEPTVDHYDCMIDIYARAGLLDKAYQLIKTMPFQPDSMSWKCLLGGCSVHCNFELGKIAAEELLQLDPEDIAAYILMFNLYVSSGKLKEAADVRRRMAERDLQKEVGCSWITIKGQVHRFIVGDKYHPQTEAIYSKLNELKVPRTKNEHVILNEDDVGDKLPERNEQLLDHSERLAIAYGLISTPIDTAIMIYKNLRACKDCHDFAKHVSGITGREIVVRDSNRFHHFKSGECSCGDYW